MTKAQVRASHILKSPNKSEETESVYQELVDARRRLHDGARVLDVAEIPQRLLHALPEQLVVPWRLRDDVAHPEARRLGVRTVGQRHQIVRRQVAAIEAAGGKVTVVKEVAMDDTAEKARD